MSLTNRAISLQPPEQSGLSRGKDSIADWASVSKKLAGKGLDDEIVCFYNENWLVCPYVAAALRRASRLQATSTKHACGYSDSVSTLSQHIAPASPPELHRPGNPVRLVQYIFWQHDVRLCLINRATTYYHRICFHSLGTDVYLCLVKQCHLVELGGRYMAEAGFPSTPRVYEYKPLSNPREFRLLLLLRSGGPNSPVTCTLIHRQLDDTPHFNAVSYAWGDPTIQRNISCDGLNLPVPLNLYNALHEWSLMPRRDENDLLLVLWADAICIDQRNLRERGDQVKLMGEIYKSCEATWVWMGEETPELQGSLESIRSITLKWAEAFPDPPEGPTEQRRELDWFHQQDWSTVANFWRLSWFTRRWVIQEIVNAPDGSVFCGSSYISWRLLRSLLFFIGRGEYHRQFYKLNLPFSSEVVTSLANLFTIGWAQDSVGALDLLDLLANMRDFKCSDKRDTLFALLGMVNLTESEIFSPDYTTDYATVCGDFARWQAEEQKSLDFMRLTIPDEPFDGDPNMPTWVLDIEGCYSYLGSFSASRNLPADAKVSPDGSKLYANGLLVDSVLELISADTTTCLRDHQLHQGTFRERFLQCKALALGIDDKLTSERYEEFWKTFVCDVGSDRSSVPEASIGELFGRFMAAIEQPDAPSTVYDFPAEQISDFSTILSGLTQSLRFCKMKSGRLGQVQSSARVGDQICVLLGCSVPLIIRPVSGNTYTLIGECYCYGLMHGEAFDLEIQTETISLV